MDIGPGLETRTRAASPLATSQPSSSSSTSSSSSASGAGLGLRQGAGLGPSIDPNREFWSLIRPQLSSERSAGWERSLEGSRRRKRNNIHSNGTSSAASTTDAGAGAGAGNNKGVGVTSSYSLHSTSGDSIGNGSLDTKAEGTATLLRQNHITVYYTLTPHGWPFSSYSYCYCYPRFIYDQSGNMINSRKNAHNSHFCYRFLTN